MKTIQVILFALLQTYSFAQDISVGGMKISWNHDETNTITFTAIAPDDGWVALGFNTKNDIVDSNLIMVSVQDDVIYSEEFYVMEIGDPRPIGELGSSIQHGDVSGNETEGSTTISFSMPTTPLDNKHYSLKKGDSIWLICAFSMEDEFDHHSRMRKHVKITL